MNWPPVRRTFIGNQLALRGDGRWFFDELASHEVQQLAQLASFNQLFVREPDFETAFQLHDEADHVDGIQAELFGEVLIVLQRLDGFAGLFFKQLHQYLSNLIAFNHLFVPHQSVGYGHQCRFDGCRHASTAA